MGITFSFQKELTVFEKLEKKGVFSKEVNLVQMIKLKPRDQVLQEHPYYLVISNENLQTIAEFDITVEEMQEVLQFFDNTNKRLHQRFTVFESGEWHSVRYTNLAVDIHLYEGDKVSTGEIRGVNYDIKMSFGDSKSLFKRETFFFNLL